MGRTVGPARQDGGATDIEGMLGMPTEVFAAFFGTEHYVEPGLDPSMHPQMTVGWPFGDAGPHPTCLSTSCAVRGAWSPHGGSAG